jgi:hypothetical protein
MWMGRKSGLGAGRKLTECGNMERSHRAKLKVGDEKAKNPLEEWFLPKDWHLELDWSAERRGKKAKPIIPLCI